MSNCASRSVGTSRARLFLWLLPAVLLWISALAPAHAQQSLFTTQTPSLPNATDGVAYELGMKFQVTRLGRITAIRYWKAASDSGTHVGRIWSSTGTLLASTTFTGGTASGWQQQALPAALAVQANTTYVVSTNVLSNFAMTQSGLATSIVNGDIRSVVGSNGVFGGTGAFPTSSYSNSNYFRDIVFIADAAPSKLLLVPATASTPAGAAVSYTATIQDANGNTLTTATNAISFSVSGVSGNFSPASPLTPTAGSATSSFTPSTTGSATIIASATGLISGTAALTVTQASGPPSKLTLVPATTTTQAGVAVSYTATIQDANGNTLTSATNAISFSVNGVSGTFSPASPVTPTNGNATSSLTPTTTGNATLIASAAGLTSASASMTVTPGVPAKLALVPATANTQAGAAVSYTATIQDANGNTVATATNSIGFSVSGVSGTFSPASPVAPTGGSATSSLTPTTTGTATVTVSASGLAVATAALTVTAGAPTKLVLLPTTATTQIGTAVNYAATIQDANGNTVAGATNPISFSVSGVSGTFGPASPVTPTGGSSTSSFTPTTTGTATITASAGGLTGATAGLTVLSGAPAKLGLVPAIAATQAGLTISYTAAIQDADGNTLTTATNAISFSVGGVSGTLSPASPVTPTGGTATSSFTPTTPGTATITASAAGLTSATASLTVIPGAPAKLALVPATGAAQAGAAVSYTATIQDANGNTISTSTSAVSFSVSGVSGTFSPASPVTPTSGSATSSFTPTTIGTGTITASASGLTSATAALTVTAGAPSKLALLPTTASVQSGTAVSYTATIQDANSNTVAGATNPISFSVSGVSGSFSPASPMAPANGTATSSLTPTAAGTATVTASAAGLTSASSTLTVSGSATPGATLVGDQVVRTGKDENPAGQAEAFSATAVASGTLTSLTVFVDATSTATQLTVGLYASSGTHPGTLLTQGTLNSPVAGTWNTVPVPNATVTSGTTYWIAVLGPVGAGILRFRDTTVGTAAETNSQSNLTALPGTWSTGSVYSNSPMSAYGSAASGPVLSVSPGTIAFSATAQGANPAPKSLSVSNPGTGTVNFTAAANQAWLTVTPSSGSAPQSLQLNASIAGLAAATYSGQVTITAAGAQGSPSVVTVTLTLTQPLGPPAKLVLVPAVAGTQTQSAVSYTATIQDANGATVATATNPISFAVSGVNGTFSPPSPVAPTAGRATTSMTPTTAGTASVTASAAGLTGASATLTVSTAPLQNDIYLENKKAGTPDVLYSLSSRYTSTVIAGYASAQSVNRGGTLDFRVSTSQPGTYSINVYRLGYYGGLGARLVTASGPLSGVTQPGCAVTDRATRLVECNWAKSYTLNLGADWTSGLYLAKLVHAATLKEHPIFFVVRNDGSTSNILVQSSRTTALAYGSYGTPTEHYSLYDYNSTNGTAALKVSLDRPSDEEDGFYNTLLRFEYQMARWLESQGYDVTYVTNIDVHSNAAQLLQHKIFLSVGHDEYWSKQMRDGVEAARDAGVNLGFFSANTAYWRVRFEPSSTGVPNRVMVCYKDPVAHPDPVEPTYRWRDPPNNRPENALLGVMYIGDHGDLFGGFNFIVSNASDPYYANTGLTNGAALSKLVGYEWDAVVNNGSTPPGLVVLGSSTVVPTTIAPGTPSTSTQISNAVRYTAPSGAQVFATGSIQWVWGLDSEGVSLARDDQRAQQFAVNILSSMGAKPVSPDPGIIVP